MSTTTNTTDPEMALPREGLTLADDLEILIRAPQDAVWDSLLNHFADWFGGGQMAFTLEPHVGGRLFRDLSATHGPGSGHLWGWVQVLKPSHLLEITGPMPVSGPGNSHVTFRLVPEGEATRVVFSSLTLGPIPPKFAGMGEGWMHALEGLKNHAERR